MMSVNELEPALYLLQTEFTRKLRQLGWYHKSTREYWKVQNDLRGIVIALNLLGVSRYMIKKSRYCHAKGHKNCGDWELGSPHCWEFSRLIKLKK